MLCRRPVFFCTPFAVFFCTPFVVLGGEGVLLGVLVLLALAGVKLRHTIDCLPERVELDLLRMNFELYSPLSSPVISLSLSVTNVVTHVLISTSIRAMRVCVWCVVKRFTKLQV